MGDGESSASEPPASQALNMAPAAFKVRDVRAHPDVQSSQTPASAPVKPFVHRHMSDRMVGDARLQVREDRNKVALFRTAGRGQCNSEPAAALDHPGSLDRRTQRGSRAVSFRYREYGKNRFIWWLGDNMKVARPGSAAAPSRTPG